MLNIGQGAGGASAHIMLKKISVRPNAPKAHTFYVENFERRRRETEEIIFKMMDHGALTHRCIIGG